MARVLYWGDSPTVGTGYGVQAAGILRALVGAGHHVTAIGRSPDADPSFAAAGLDRRSVDAFVRAVPAHDVLLVIGDPSVAPPREVLGDKPAVFYTGTDWPSSREVGEVIDGYDVVVAANRYGMRCLETGARLRRTVEIIPHGHDLDIFRPSSIDNDDVMLVNVAQNTPRKNLSALIAAFGVFQHDLRAQGRRAVLYLHTCPIDRVPPWGRLIDLGAVARSNGLEPNVDVIFPGEAPPHGVLSSPRAIAELLASADAFVSSSLSEGWCLPVTEAMACGTAVIVPGHTVFPELAAERGWIYPVDGRAPVPEMGGDERPVVPPAAILAGMRAWWNDRRKGFDAPVRERARAFVQTLGWDRIGARWQELFRRIA